MGIMHRLPAPEQDTRPVRAHRAGLVLGSLGAVGVLLAASWWQLRPAQPETAPIPQAQLSAPTSTCSWSEHRFDPLDPGRYSYRAVCEGVGEMRAAIEDGTTLTGTVGSLPLQLTLDPSSDAAMFDTTWVGSLGQTPVALVVQGFAVAAGSQVGEGQLRCPAPPVMAGDWSWLDADPAVVEVAYSGDPQVSADLAGALCNLMTFGLPASSYGFAKGELESGLAG